LGSNNTDGVFSLNICRGMNPSRLRWAKHVARMGKKIDTYRNLVRKTEGQWPFTGTMLRFQTFENECYYPSYCMSDYLVPHRKHIVFHWERPVGEYCSLYWNYQVLILRTMRKHQ
jgi:hypothetical protein